MADTRYGSQTPTTTVVLPYSETKGKEAIALYGKTGSSLYPWQENLLKDILAIGANGLWVHMKYGYAVSRRNGKSETVNARILWGLENGEKIIYTAHRTATGHAMWERICDLLSCAGYKDKEDFTTLKQYGFETIKMLKTGATVNFRTRSSKGGLGEGYDLLVVDEAQEYTEDQAAALKYLVSASDNPQIIYLGTPPTPQSSGTVFQKYRESCLNGKAEESGWAEWAVDSMSDPMDRDLWYLTNPSLGYRLTERVIANEFEGDKVDFNIQRLGLWLAYNLKSAISQTEWEALACRQRPEKGKDVFVGVKFGIDGKNVAMAFAFRNGGQIFVEVVDCQPVRNGIGWILDKLIRMQPRRIVIDGRSGQQMLADELKKAKIKGCVLPDTSEIIKANALFEQGVYDGSICHMNQPALSQSVANCSKRPIGGNGGFGYKSLKEDVEISLMDSVILAHWACHENKEARKQRVSY